jgi:hypothetical protein
VAGVPYTTVDAVKIKLGISGDPDPVLDPYLEGLIVQVSSLFDTIVFGPIDGFSGFAASVDITEFHDGGESWIIAERLIDGPTGFLPIREPVVIEDGVTLVEGTDFFLGQFPSNTLFRLAGAADAFDAVFTSGYRNVKLTYRPAYSTIPADVIRATDEETVRAYKAGNSNSVDGGFIGITGRTPDAGTTLSYTADDLTATTMRMLDGYRKRLRFF